MKKLEGLKFLQENFPDLTVDCLFVDRVENLNEKDLHSKNKDGELWRVRGGKITGSELNLPQGTFTNVRKLKKFMKEQQKKDANMEFVIHRVSPEYFEAQFVGTLAVYNNKNMPRIRIELQRVTKDLVDNIDKGKRPRDWEVCLILDYDLLYKFPKVLKNDGVDLEEVKHAIAVIHKVGEQIFEFYDKKGQDIDTYSRFNIYSSGRVLFDDHRSVDSFISKCKCHTISRESFKPRKSKVEEREL